MEIEGAVNIISRENEWKANSTIMSSTDSLPALIPTDSEPPIYELGTVELEMHKFTSMLAQIEVASCFRGQPEPLFRELSPIIYAIDRL